MDAHHALCQGAGCWAPWGARSGPGGAHLAPQQRTARPTKRNIFTPAPARTEGRPVGQMDSGMGLVWCFYKLRGQLGTALPAFISLPDPGAQRSPSASQHGRGSGAAEGGA